jgi:hypothetical protein
VLRGLKRFTDERYATARDMARAIEAAVPLATMSDVSAWLESLVGPTLVKRATEVARIEGEAPSRVITVTDVSPVIAPRVSRAPRAIWVVGAVALVGIGVAMGALLRSPAPATKAAVVSSNISSTPPFSSTPPSPPPSVVADIDSLPSADPAPSPSVKPDSGRPPPQPPGPGRRDPKCKFKDSSGIWHIKQTPECFK